MGITTCIIEDITYLVQADPGQPFQADDVIEMAGQMQVTIQDPDGLYNFTRGQPVSLVDSVTGPIYNGFVLSSQPSKLGPASTFVEHTLTCTDQNYRMSKQANTQDYQDWYAGDIAVDFVTNGLLGDEGITVAAALRRDSTNDDFNTGILSGTVGTLNDNGDGCLELTPAGSDVSFSEKTTADFAIGTLTNCTAANNQLSPNTQNALKFSVFLPISSDKTVDSFIYAKIWTGNVTIAGSDTLFYDVWIADSSPEKVGSIEVLFDDLTFPVPLYDQNLVPDYNDQDLSAYAVNQWYSRSFDLSGYSGRHIIAVIAQSGGHSVGTYTWYVRNCYIASQSGNKFFSTTQTAPQLNPPQIYQYQKYVAASFTASVVTTFDPNNSYRISTSHSIDLVKLIKSTNILWESSANVLLYASYNGGSSWIPCTNGSSLPALPAGSNVAGLSMQLKEVFGAGDDPTGIPVLDSVTVSLLSAPNATKSDIVTSFLTQSNWNTGTHSGTQADVSGNLELAPYTRDWADHSTTGQTNFFPSGTSATASSGAYVMTCPLNNNTNTNGFGTSRLDFLGTALDFTLECDVKTSNVNMEASITYRQIYWNSSTNNTFGYVVGVYPGNPGIVEIGYGSNSNSDSFTQLAQITPSLSPNTTYHVKLVLNGNRHRFYFNNATTPTFDISDDTYTQAGGIGLRGFNSPVDAGSATATWDNLVLAQTPSGTWTSPSTSISSLTTCGGSVITWMEQNTANAARAYDFVQSSIDGGSTYQQCISGQPIPGLTNGVSLSGKSVKIQVLLGTQTNDIPMVSGLVWRVLGQYPGSTGTRSTAPMGIDYVDRGNQSAFGTASDGQTWAKVGTGTDAVSSNALTITNTTGDLIELLGTRTGNDMDETTHFSLSAATIPGGMVLRYVDSTHYYKLQASTTALSIIKRNGGTTTTLGTTSISLATATPYWMRFRIVGSGPIDFYGKVWAADGATLEPDTWNVTALE